MASLSRGECKSSTVHMYILHINLYSSIVISTNFTDRFAMIQGTECGRFLDLFPVVDNVTTLGLAVTHSYYTLRILVPALWRFRFPETLMHLYLGVFNKKAH